MFFLNKACSTVPVGELYISWPRPSMQNQRAIKARLAITVTQEQGKRKPLIMMSPRADEFN